MLLTTSPTEAATAVVAIGGALAVVGGYFRWARPKYRATKSDARAIRDTLVGRPAIKDSITGREISPAIPSIGERMATQEAQQGAMAEALAELAKSHRRIDDLDARVTAIEQGHHFERMTARGESIQLLRTIEAVAEAQPPEKP